MPYPECQHENPPESKPKPDRKTLYLTDSANGEIRTAQMPVAGKVMFGLTA